MICLALGLGVLGFVAARKARRCSRGYYGYGWHHHHHHGWGGRGRRGLYMALSHIDASPAQERAIVAEVDKLRERLHTARAGLKDGRGDLAAAVPGSGLRDAAPRARVGPRARA